MSIGTVVFLLLFAFIAGGVVGALLSQRVGPSSTQRKLLEEQLKQAQQELKDYQAEVTDTFAETAKRVNKLTASYKDVHDHLAQSAIKLTSPAVGQQFLETNNNEPASADSPPPAPSGDEASNPNSGPSSDPSRDLSRAADDAEATAEAEPSEQEKDVASAHTSSTDNEETKSNETEKA
ncbi:Z-ring associated ZapG family protein [Aurantivibrio plasticivorans]